MAPPYRPYRDGPFRWRLGVRPLDLDQWFELDGDDVDAQLLEKARILDQHHSTVVAVMDGIEPEAEEVYAAVVEHLSRRAPDHLARHHQTPAGRHPLEAAARLGPEDLALLVERDGSAVFGGGVICFPNRWDLRSKLGQPLATVHAPVAQLNEQLGDPIERFFDRLTPDRSYWRLGWGVLDTPALYQPLDGTAAPRPGSTQVSVDDVHLRVERETLRRFGQTGAVMFTIRTHITPLRELFDDPADAVALAEVITSMPDDIARYKQLDELGPRVVAWLRGDDAELGSER